MKIHWKIDRIEIIIRLLSWLVFVICGFIKNFLPNSYFIFQIYHVKSFKWGMLPICKIFNKIFIKCFKNSILLSGPYRFFSMHLLDILFEVIIDIVLLSNIYYVIFFLWSAFVSMFFFDHQNSLILDLDKNIPNWSCKLI